MNRKLTDQQVVDIRSSTLPTSELASVYGIHHDNILLCRKSKTYKHVKKKCVPYLLRNGILTDSQVISARSGIKSANVLSKEFGISTTNIEFARSGKYHKKVEGYVTDKNYRERKISYKKIRRIKYFLERGYLNYIQLAKYFKVSTQTIYNLNTYGNRGMGRRRKYNQITYTYFKVLYDQLGSYQKVADEVGAKEINVYRLLTGYRS